MALLLRMMNHGLETNVKGMFLKRSSWRSCRVVMDWLKRLVALVCRGVEGSKEVTAGSFPCILRAN